MILLNDVNRMTLNDRGVAGAVLTANLGVSYSTETKVYWSGPAGEWNQGPRGVREVSDYPVGTTRKYPNFLSLFECH